MGTGRKTPKETWRLKEKHNPMPLILQTLPIIQLELRGLNFFGTTFKANESQHITVEDCNFMYPSYSKRMLGRFVFD